MSAFLISVFEFLTFLQTHSCVLLSHNSWDLEGVLSERTCGIGTERKELSNQVVCTGLWLGAHEEVRGVIISTTELSPTWEQCWLFPLGLCPSLHAWTDYFKEVLHITGMVYGPEEGSRQSCTWGTLVIPDFLGVNDESGDRGAQCRELA